MQTIATAPADYHPPMRNLTGWVNIDHADKTYSVTVDPDGTIGRVVHVEYQTIDGMRDRRLQPGKTTAAMIERAAQAVADYAIAKATGA